MENFALRVQRRLQHFLRAPAERWGYIPTVSTALLTDARAYLRAAASGQKHCDQILNAELSSNRIERILQQMATKLDVLGVTESASPDLVRKCAQYVIEYLVTNYPCHLEWTPVRLGIQDVAPEVEEIERRIRLTNFKPLPPWDELDYVAQIGLAAWTGDTWSVTPAGKIALGLSVPAVTVFLLRLEAYLSGERQSGTGTAGGNYISSTFLRKLDREGATVDIGQGEYSLADLDPDMSKLDRLTEFCLVETRDRTEERRAGDDPRVLHLADEYFECELTTYGRQIIESVLEHGSPMSLIIEHAVAQELSGRKYIAFSTSEGLDELVEAYSARKNASITGDQGYVIQQIVDEVEAGKATILTLRAVPPTIERVLKNILVSEGAMRPADQNQKTLGASLAILAPILDGGRAPISRSTAHFIRSIDRNAVLHGNVTPAGVILDALLNLALGTLLEIYRDYSLYKETGRGFG